MRDKKRRPETTPYQRIKRAHDRGTGLRLTYEDVHALMQDHAIREAAENDDDPEYAEPPRHD